jgi:hypothetical protein
MNRITNEHRHSIPVFFLIVLFLCIFLLYSTGIIADHSTQEQQDVLESAIQRSLVQCYALEGQYPDNIDYLEQHYGLTYDKTKFQLKYQYSESNVMPEISVIPLKN